MIKVMIDGRSVAFRTTSGNWLGPELIPLSAVDRIEIIRGPASALYGADAFLGVVNIVTRGGGDVQGGVVQAGVQRAFTDWQGNPGGDLEGVAGFRKNRFEMLVAARVHNENRSGLHLPDTSPAPFVPSYRTVNDEAAGLRLGSRVAFAKMSFDITSSIRLRWFGHINQIERSGEFSHWAQLTTGMDRLGRWHNTIISLYQGSTGLELKSRFGPNMRLLLWTRYSFGGPTARDRVDIGNSIFYVRRELDYQEADGSIELAWTVTEPLTLVAGVEGIFVRQQLPSRLSVLNIDSGELSAGDVWSRCRLAWEAKTSGIPVHLCSWRGRQWPTTSRLRAAFVTTTMASMGVSFPDASASYRIHFMT
ncbi:MAG: TonB-dependent receptor plug domain-containing protein [Gammaproteobacteria bacterium]|nr:TonB-dependent receptor plug domain-containing protein [Gammaproteobacteria bacterium]